MNVVLEENVLDDTLGIFEYLDAINIEYRKQYKGMYGRQMTVPRGQASFTISEDIHYNYKVAGGSPPNRVMCEKLRNITEKVKYQISPDTFYLNSSHSGSNIAET